MTSDKTQPMSDEDQLLAKRWSLDPSRPPAQIPGYVLHRLLGTGTYGQVWLGTDENTGRSVAIKFYAHRGGLDWSLLSREVEKLAFLASDRYVVQVLDVGWNAEPPYCVMEFVEQGSVADWLDSTPGISLVEAEQIIRQIAIGLMHAHAKGILHCDLKPANVLLDQDRQPRLADFGQARLSYEQTPSLGTLFYMAPEQADLSAIPDVRWDIYSLGAMLFRMLTGYPPYYSQEAAETLQKATGLEDRLAKYRELITKGPSIDFKAAVPGIDRELAAILHHCLAVNPKHRYASVQALLYDLEARASRRARRPLLLMGLVGPIVILLLAAFFAVDWMDAIMDESREELVRRALEGNRFAARLASGQVEDDLGRRFELVEGIAQQEELKERMDRLVHSESWQPKLEQLATHSTDDPAIRELQREYQQAAKRLSETPPGALEAWLLKLGKSQETTQSGREIPIASWLICDRRGVCLGRWPSSDTIGVNYVWRAYFHGGPKDFSPEWQSDSARETPIVKTTYLSPVFLSQASNRWVVGISSPIRKGEEILGVLTMTFEVGQIIDLPEARYQIPVLVNKTAEQHAGIILDHPLYEQPNRAAGQFVESQFRLTEDEYPERPERKENYQDPLSRTDVGAAFAGRWLAEMVPIQLQQQDTGWVVIVQEAYEDVIGKPFRETRRRLFWLGMRALAVCLVVSAAVWFVLIRVLMNREHRQRRRFGLLGSTTSSSSSMGSQHSETRTPSSASQSHD